MQQSFCSSKIIAFLRQLFLEKTKFLEKHTFYQHTLLGKIYLKAYQNLVSKEIDMAKIECKSKVLHIGGGIPYTATIIASLTGAEVTVLEINDEVMHAALKWLRKYGCEDKVKIVLADGSKFSAADFDVVIISLSIAPKKTVLLNVLDTSQIGTRIVYRKAKKIFSAIYGDIEPLGGCKSYVKKKVFHCGLTLKASYLLIKDGG